MRALMQDWSMTLDKILDHAARWHGDREIVTRSVEGPVARSTYAEVAQRARQVSHGLLELGVKPGDRVATLGWNSDRHLEAWYGAIGIGAVLHTLNPRLFPEQIVYIANHAADQVLLADPACAPLLGEILPQCPTIRTVIFLCGPEALPETPFAALDYESWIAGRPADAAWGGFDENTAAGLCYTSGTTGNPKGVLYGHRSNYIHAMMTLQPDALNLSGRDTVLLIVPMYHANAWGVIYSAPMVGAKLVLPGPKLDGASLHELIETEGVTYSAACQQSGRR
jgi:fatty-acyl-CoA synthase